LILDFVDLINCNDAIDHPSVSVLLNWQVDCYYVTSLVNSVRLLLCHTCTFGSLLAILFF